MNEMISMCGLLCHECPAFQATQADDDAKRAEVAALWSKEYGANIKPEDIHCDGCLSTSGRVINHANTCEIRNCETGKDLVNCGHCSDYACGKLDMIFKMAPEAKERLDGIYQG